MQKTALLIVDVQCAMIDSNPFDEVNVIENIRKLIDSARQNDIEVIYVQHDGGVGDELEKNTSGWEICPKIAPLSNEKVIDKEFNSAFRKTSLQEHLTEKGIETIILSGMQTEFCIDTTCRVAFELGYDVVIPADTTTTYDNIFLIGKEMREYYEQGMWNGRFAKVISVEEVIKKYIS